MHFPRMLSYWLAVCSQVCRMFTSHHALFQHLRWATRSTWYWVITVAIEWSLPTINFIAGLTSNPWIRNYQPFLNHTGVLVCWTLCFSVSIHWHIPREVYIRLLHFSMIALYFLEKYSLFWRISPKQYQELQNET